MTEENRKLLKILCLHGYRQNAQLFKAKTGAFRKAVKQCAELVYVTAPNIVPSTDENGEDIDVDKRGWWFSNENDAYVPDERTDLCKGYFQSIDVITKFCKIEGPFDGILGFSQGAAMVSLLCGLQTRDGDNCPFDFKFAILIAGFKSHSSPHDHLYSKPIMIPSLHVYGSADKVIGKGMSEELLNFFDHPVTMEHDGGHFVPASSQQKKSYLEFLKEVQQTQYHNT